MSSAKKFYIDQGIEQGREIWLKQGIEQGRDIGLKQGIEQGRDIWLQKGIEQGRDIWLQKGIEQGLLHDRERLVRLLERRLGSLSEAGRERVMGAAQDQLDLWLERLLVATDEAEVFAEEAE